jgi:hypothetical protein
MIDTLFNTNKTKAIQTKSKSVLDIFTKTVEDLSLLNNNIDTEARAKQEEIDRLTSEMNMLNDLKEQHIKVIGKINNLFE